MTADGNISQSLGLLRIANPDEESTYATAIPQSTNDDIFTQTKSPPAHDVASVAEPLSKEHQGPGFGEQSNVHSQQAGSVSSQLDSYSPDSMNSPAILSPSSSERPRTQRLSHRLSMPLNHQSQQDLQYPPYVTSIVPQARNNIPMQGTSSVRPISNLYGNGNKYSNSDISISASNRSRNDGSPQISESGVSRRSSRSIAAAQHGTPLRTDSGSNSPRMQIGSEQLPSRRSSRAAFSDAMDRRTSATNIQIHGTTNGPEGLPAKSSEDWKERGAAVAVRQELDADGKPTVRYFKKGVKDFNFSRTLGEGSYSTVVAATDQQTRREYAVKILDKGHIIKEKKVKYVNIEKDALNRLTDHPGVVRLKYTFQDERSLYFVLDLATGGELLGVLKKITTFNMKCTRFYGAQILDAVDYMHTRGVIHRDLKPENILLDDRMHVKITDFGTAKILGDHTNRDRSGSTTGNPLSGAESDRAVSFVGTAEYVSPELLLDKNACKASDLWAFGCIIYQLLAGRPPFKAKNEYYTFQKIVGLEYTYPDGFPEVAKDLVDRLLVRDPAKRLPVEHIKNHQFFEGIQWGKDLWKQKAPRLQPFLVPAQEPIKLNGSPTSYQNNASNSQVNSTQQYPNSQLRPAPRLITELPPPSQLDIDWSPVLTRNNERILKLGNLIVTSTSNSQPSNVKGSGSEPVSETSRKLSRFFGGNTMKKRQRLVMITSSARLILAAAGGAEKKAKMEVSLLGPSVTWSSQKDSKGITFWFIETVSTTCVEIQLHYKPSSIMILTACSEIKSLHSKIRKQQRVIQLAVAIVRKSGWKLPSERESLVCHRVSTNPTQTVLRLTR